MRFKTLECPNCGAPIKPPNGIEAFYCQHCGYHIILEDLTDAEVNASVKFGRMWHKERMRDKQYEENHNAWVRGENTKHYEFLRYFLYLAFLFGLLFVIGTIMSIESNNEEKQLSNTVDEIIQDINDGNYSEARIKAQSLYYTSGESEEHKKKWDDTREQLLKEIDKAEKEAKKSERQGLFGLFGDKTEEPEPNEEDHGFTNSQ